MYKWRRILAIWLMVVLMMGDCFLQPVSATLSQNVIVGEEENTVSDNEVPDEVPEETIPEDILPEEEDTVSDNELEEDTPSDSTLSDNAASNNTVSSNTVSRNSVSENTVSDNAVAVPTYALGGRDIDYEPGKSKLQELDDKRMVNYLPVAFDARTANMVTPVKDQNPYGTCWSFSSMALAESSLLSQGYGMTRAQVDLAERHLVYFLYNATPLQDPLGNSSGDFNAVLDDPYNTGGNIYIATFGLANWVGAADEAIAPYRDIPNPLDANSAFQDVAHLQNAYFYNKTDTAAIKQKIMSSGAVSVSYYSDTYFYKQTDATYFYCPQSIPTNHAVTIVGWDDTIRKDKFITPDGVTPSRAGAWLIKNSWGTNWGDSGYFWISYEDQTLSAIIGMDYEPANNYDHNYFYDGTAAPVSIAVESGTSLANVYVTKSDAIERLEAVSFAPAVTDIAYSIQIYKNPVDVRNPSSGTAMLQKPQKGVTRQEGYYTVSLDTPVYFKKGDTFAVVVTLQNADGSTRKVSHYVDATVDFKWVRFNASHKANESFFKYPGNTRWNDLVPSDVSKGMTARIKAFTDKIEWTLDTTEMQLELEGADAILSIVDKEEIIDPKMVSWSSSNEAVVTVEDGVLTPKSIGDALITVMDVNGKSATCTVEIRSFITNCTVTLPSKLEYTGEPLIPDLVVTQKGKTLTKGTDYEVTATDNTDVGTATLQIKGINYYGGSVERKFTITPRTITNVDVILPTDVKFAYSGVPLTPEVTLKDGERTLVKEKDYVLTYTNNTNKSGTTTASQALIKITGRNNYVGMKTQYFRIEPRNIEEVITKVESEADWIGTSSMPAITLDTVNGKALVKGKDYNITVTNNKEIGSKGQLTITGMNNFTGSVVRDFTVIAYRMEKATITLSKGTVVYTGGELKPTVAVKAGSKVLKSGVDYTITYTNNIQAGIANVTVQGIGNYSGAEMKSFTIEPKSIAKVNVAAEKTKYTNCTEAELATGITPMVTVTDKTNRSLENGKMTEGTDYEVTYLNHQETGFATVAVKGINNYSLLKEVVYVIEGSRIEKIPFDKIPAQTYQLNELGEPLDITPEVTMSKYTGTPLVKDKDYYIIYRRNTQVGTANAIVIGKGMYSGSKIITFPIQKRNLQEDNVQIEAIADATYTKAPITPEVKMKYGYQDATLVKGTDYTVTYSNHINVTTQTKKARITIKGKGNYQGTILREFHIQGKTFENNLEITTPQLTYTGKPLMPNPTVMARDASGKNFKLLKNKDYSIQVEAGTNIGAMTQVVTVPYKIIGKGNFQGEHASTFDIMPKLPTNLTVKYMTSKIYTGEAITYDDNGDNKQEGIQVFLGKTKLEEGKDYRVSFQNNQNVGRASIIIRGISDKFYGVKTAMFTIKPKPLTDSDIQTTSVGDVYYNGNKELPKVQMTDGAVPLLEGSDYTLSTTSVQVGIGTVTVKGKGNYTSTIKRTYQIQPLVMELDKIEVRFKNGSSYRYTATKIQPQVDVYYKPNGLGTKEEEYVLLKPNVAYTLKYYNNINVGSGNAQTDPYLEVKRKDSRNNWSGSITTIQKTFKIESESLDKAVVRSINDQTFRGYRISPKVSLKVGKVTLKEGRDYILIYDKNTKRGIANITIQAVNAGNYINSTNATFLIK